MHDVIIPEEKDFPAVSRLLWTAFQTTGAMVDAREWGLNTPPDNWSYIIRDGKEAVSHFSFNTYLDSCIRGAQMPFAGIWGVTTAPTHRRKGMLRALFDASLKKMKQEGLVFSVLDPSYIQIYERFGYANAEQYARYTFPPQQLRQPNVPAEFSMREIPTAEGVEIVNQLQRSMARFGSRIFMAPRRYEKKMDHRYLIERGGEPVGTVKVDFQGGTDFRSDIHITVSRAMYVSEDVLPAVVQLIRGFSDQCKEFTWECDLQTPVHHYISERHRITSEVCGSMMVRVIDFEGFCSRIHTPAGPEASLALALEDVHCPWNSGLYRLLPSGGELRVQRLAQGEAIPEVTLDAFQLSQVVSGLTPAVLLHGLGELDCRAETAHKLEAIFPADNFYAYQRF